MADLPLFQRHPPYPQQAWLRQSAGRGHAGREEGSQDGPDLQGPRRHLRRLPRCVKTREKPFRDIALATHTAAVCHLGNIAYQLKRSLKWDAAKNEFPGDEEANRLVDRARREPWTL